MPIPRPIVGSGGNVWINCSEEPNA